jgi:hypothetical protein
MRKNVKLQCSAIDVLVSVEVITTHLLPSNHHCFITVLLYTTPILTKLTFQNKIIIMRILTS